MSYILNFANQPYCKLQIPELGQYYSLNGYYKEARDRFVENTEQIGAKHIRLNLSEIPNHEDLTIDIAYVGEDNPKKLFIVTSGIHGVELFHGSAIQVDLLKSKPQLPQDCGLLLVHALNPYGAKYSRRANENNIDLNRNFRLKVYAKEEEQSDILEFVNPTTAEKLANSLVELDRIFKSQDIDRLTEIITAVGVGQYSNPEGIIYSGARLAESYELLTAYLRESFTSLDQIVVLDFHSGLGEKASLKVLSQAWNNGTSLDIPPGIEHFCKKAKDVVPYFDKVKGTVGDGLAELFPSAKILLLGAEFGTETFGAVLQALINENYAHFRSEDSEYRSGASLCLSEAFFPKQDSWRQTVLALGSNLITELSEFCFVDL